MQISSTGISRFHCAAFVRLLVPDGIPCCVRHDTGTGIAVTETCISSGCPNLLPPTPPPQEYRNHPRVRHTFLTKISASNSEVSICGLSFVVYVDRWLDFWAQILGCILSVSEVTRGCFSHFFLKSCRFQRMQEGPKGQTFDFQV